MHSFREKRKKIFNVAYPIEICNAVTEEIINHNAYERNTLSVYADYR